MFRWYYEARVAEGMGGIPQTAKRIQVFSYRFYRLTHNDSVELEFNEGEAKEREAIRRGDFRALSKRAGVLLAHNYDSRR